MKSQENYYGNLMLSDDSTSRKKKKENRFYASIFLFVGALLIGLCLLAMDWLGIIFLLAAGISNIIFGWYLATLKYSEFRIYENGIRLSSLKVPFIQFSEIDHVCRLEGKTFLLILRNGSSYSISNTHAAIEEPVDWDHVYTLITEQLRKRFPQVNTNYLIRDIFNVPWTEDAKREWNSRRIFAKTNYLWSINEAVLEQGRNLVELSDVKRFLR